MDPRELHRLSDPTARGGLKCAFCSFGFTAGMIAVRVFLVENDLLFEQVAHKQCFLDAEEPKFLEWK